MSESCGNPLLLGWIKEWLDQARERNSKGVIVYKKAYESMKACPLVFQHPSEAQQLNGLGPKLCDRLADKLKVYCEENGLPMPERPENGNKRLPSDSLPDLQPVKKARRTKPYVPALRSGPYALLLGLATLSENASQGMTKAQLIEVAQPHCDSSFTAPSDPTKFHTAWSSMKLLVQKDLVYEHGRPLRKYALSEEGWEIVKKIQNTLPEVGQSTLSFGPKPTDALAGRMRSRGSSLPIHDVASQIRPAGSTTETSSHEQLKPFATEHNSSKVSMHMDDTTATSIRLPPGSFTIQLVLDNREVRTSKDRDYIASELTKKGVEPDVRALELGDAMWVAKLKDPSFLRRYGEGGCDEIVLDWIVERKRLDDLVGSIKDGRFHEQKFRLRRSGIKNVIYLIEEFNIIYDSSSPSASKYQEMVSSAIAATQVVNGYFVKKTKNLDDSIRYLARMTSLLRNMYESPGRSSQSSGSSLALIPSCQISSAQTYLSVLSSLRAKNPSVTYGVTSLTLSAITSKSDVLSLRDVFLKMLMCTRGVTGEKALEIQRRWQTPRAFIEAFEALGPGEREAMISDQTKTLVGRKKIAKGLSKKIAEIWGMGSMAQS